MIRNHMLDPENTPPKGSFPQKSSSAMNDDDPWYTSSGPSSPMGGNPMANTGFYQPQGGQFGGGASNAGGNSWSGGFGGVVAPASGEDYEDYDNEPPLLEELGIRFDHIWSKTQAVLYINKPVTDEHIMDDTDLAGPVFFALLLGAALLLSRKVQFGYIYGFSVCGCLAIQAIVTLMHPAGLDFWRTCSVLGYCLLPVIGLATLGIVMNLTGALGLILSAVCIAWSTYAATRLIDAKLHLTEQYWLVAYPIMLVYSCFVLITIF